MYLDFRKIDSSKREPPMLRLQTLSGKELGTVPFAYGVHFAINYSELSTIEFEVPYMVNGIINPAYALLTGYKVIYTDELGVYLITSPEKSGDGMSEVKKVKGYSLEYSLQNKGLYLEEGTYNFWNPLYPDETILGRVTELDPNWSVGYVAPRLIGCYRTFDEYDDNALGFLYGDAMESYRCAVVFDVYNKTINAYDAGDDAASLPVYLDYQNLIKEINVEEITDDMATKLYAYGADSLSIRNVNPMGTDYLVDLSYFLSNGDLDITASDGTEMLSDKVRRWDADIAENRSYYTGLASLRYSSTSQKLTANAQLVELQGELQSLTAQQSVYIQEYALASSESEKAKIQGYLDDIYGSIESKNAEIASKETEIANIQAEIDGYVSALTELTGKYSISGYFTEGERLLLAPYLIEGTLEEDTFVTSDAADTGSAALSSVTGTVSVTNSEITRVTLTEFSRTMYTVSGGNLTVPTAGLSAEIVRGTLDVKSGDAFTLSAYLGKLTYGSYEFDSGMITLTGTLSGFAGDIGAVTENNIVQYLGSKFSFSTDGAASYFTVASGDYQQYAVEMELYDFAADALSDYAYPVYEFSIDSANFLYHELFEPFKNKLELGKAVYLRLGSEGVIQPKIIGVELDFDSIDDFKLVFSNRYQRKNQLEYLQDELRSAASSSRSFDASKYLYDRTADKMTDVAEYMNGALDAATQTIIAAKNQSVIVDGAGIHITSTDTTAGNDKIQMRIVNGMIAMTNDNWKTAKLAIGRFYSSSLGMDVWGVNAELIAGSLIIGSNLYIETENGHFSVDNEGVYIDSMKFYINNGDASKSLDNTLTDIDSSIQSVSGDVAAVSYKLNSVTTTADSGDVYLNASDLSGLISAAQAQMAASGGNVLFDSDGIWLMNAPSKAQATLAVWANENGILFGSGSKTSDPANNWTDWTVAISHSGVVADNIAAGTLSGMTINGGEITIGKNSSSDTDYLYIDSFGCLGIGANFAALQGYNFYVDNMGNLYSGYNSGTGDYNFKVSKSGAITAKSINVSGGTFDSISVTNGSFAGTLSGVDGTFTGTLKAAKINGLLTADDNAWVVGCGLAIGSPTYSGSTPTGANFFVDSNGNVTIKSGSISWGAVTGTDEIDTRISNAQSTANSASSTASTAQSIAKAIANGTYSSGSFISGQYIYSPTIYSPTIYADQFIAEPLSGSSGGSFLLRAYYNSKEFDMFRISYYAGDGPYVYFESPAGALGVWSVSPTRFDSSCTFAKGYTCYFEGTVNFSNATVTGLTTTATFA